MKISDYAVDHPVPVTIFVAVLTLFGFMAVSSLTQAMFPDINKPTVNVTVSYPGVSPEEIELQVTSPIEDELSKISGVRKISSRSLPSRSVVTLEFEWSVRVDDKLMDIRERLNAIQPKLPDGVSGSPVIRTVNPGEMPVLTVGVENVADRVAAARYLEAEIIPLLSTISGVSSVELVGGPNRELAVEIDLARLNSRGATPLEVAQALAVSNVELPAGNARIGDSTVNLTAVSEFSSPERAGDVVVGVKGNAATRVADVADVRLREKDDDRFVVVNGERALLIDVVAQNGADTIKVIREAKKRLAALEANGDSPLSYAYYRDQSTSIEASVKSVRDSALLGGALAVLVLYLFLGSVGPTLIIAASIPFTVLMTFIALYLGGSTLNTMTLGGLTVAIGMIVDASIVMLEATWRHADSGLDGKAAAKLAGGEMGGAIVASTLTSVVVFAPLVFVTGITGIVLRDIALTIIYALSGSVVSAVFVVPFLSARILGRRGARPSPDVSPLADGQPTADGRERDTAGPAGGRGPLAAIQRAIRSFEAAYGRALDRALGDAPFLIVAGVAVLFLSVSMLGLAGYEFIPDSDTREIIVELDVPDGFPVESTLSAAKRADELIAKAVPEAARRVFYVGQSSALSSSAGMASHAYGFVTLTEKGRSAFELVPAIKSAIESELPDVKAKVRNGGNSEKTAMAMGGSGFRLDVSGNDMDSVMASAKTIAGILREDPEIESVELSVSDDILKLTDRVDLDLAGSLSVSPADAAQTGRLVFNGVEVGEFDDGGTKIPVVVRADYGDSATEDLFYSIPVRARSGKTVSLASFSSIERGRGFSEVPRVDKASTVQVIGTLTGKSFRGAKERTEAKLALLDFPAGVSWRVGGSAAETASSFRSLALALAIGILLVYAVMAIQFERYRQPLIVLSAIPFTLIGVSLALLLFGSSLSIVAILGLIALAGVAVNNAIIMIDYTNLLRSRDGVPLREAILRGATSRVRPILMTTLTTLLGVLPLAFASGGAATMAVLGQVLLFGLATSTLITFFVTPCLYWLTERGAERAAGIPEASK